MVVFSIAAISYASNVFWVVLDWTIMRALPVTIKIIAVKSYRQMNASPRQVIDRQALTMRAVAEFAVNRVKSAKGSTPIFKLS